MKENSLTIIGHRIHRKLSELCVYIEPWKVKGAIRDTSGPLGLIRERMSVKSNMVGSIVVVNSSKKVRM